PDSMDAALARDALAVAALDGDAALYDKYMDHLKKAKTPEEYYSYFGALGQFQDTALTKRTFDFALSPAVKNQDMFLVLRPLRNYATQTEAWELFKSDFTAIMTKAGGSLGSARFAMAAGLFCDEKLRDDS